MFKIFLWTLLLVSLITPNLSFGNISLVAAKRRIVKKSIKKPKIIQQSASLNVIFSKQDYSLSCEVASLQMALAYKGIVVSEDELLSQIPKTGPFVKEFQPDSSFVWGDPDIGFVGDANGKWKGTNGLVDGTGWGVNYGPIANLTQSYRESSYGKRGGNSQDLRSELNAGNPVIIWEQSDKTIKEEVYYKTETGKDIKFIQDHVVLITGYRVSKKHGFVYTIKDPFYGETIWSEARLNRYWSRYNNDMVVVK